MKESPYSGLGSNAKTVVHKRMYFQHSSYWQLGEEDSNLWEAIEEWKEREQPNISNQDYDIISRSYIFYYL